MYCVKSDYVRVLDTLIALERSFDSEPYREEIGFADSAFFDDNGASTIDEAASAQSGGMHGPRASA
jgi:hypothetical protein